jgi:hypothetical protein
MEPSQRRRSGIAPARVESAAAVLRRVVEDSVTSGVDRAVTDRE